MPGICLSPLCVSAWQGPLLVNWGEDNNKKDHKWISGKDWLMSSLTVSSCEMSLLYAHFLHKQKSRHNHLFATKTHTEPVFMSIRYSLFARTSSVHTPDPACFPCYNGATLPTSDTPTWWSEQVHWTQVKFKSVSFGVRVWGGRGNSRQMMSYSEPMRKRQT